MDLLEQDQQLSGQAAALPSYGDQQDKPKRDEKPEDDSASQKASVESWLKRIEKAEEKFKDDFDRMRDNMDFVAGLQWNGQKGITYDKYVANWTIRAVNQGVATLYAKNPQVEIKRNSNRLNYALWDGKIETIQMAMQLMQMSQVHGLPLPPDIMQVVQDFQRGRTREVMVDRVAKTLQFLCQQQLDRQVPDFKTQMKQLVRRVNVCGVGYIKVSFCREGEEYSDLTQSKTRLTMSDRLHAIKAIADKISKGKVEEQSAEIERLRMLLLSLQLSPLDVEASAQKESVVFDFPRATSIIPDPSTRTLKGFIGGRWIAEKMFFPLSFVNEFFEVDIDIDSEVKLYDNSNKPDEGSVVEGEDRNQRKVCVYVVRDLDTKSEFTICRGHKKYLCEPETISPCPREFWNIFPVTFNDVESEEGCEATIFPPSLVDLVKPSQKEWNRVRQALRRHRRANGPKYGYIDGTLSDEDLDRLSEAEDQEYVKFKDLPAGADPSKVLMPIIAVDIKPELYNAEPLREDSLLTSGQQEANQGPPQPNITATGVNVAEQSRMGVAASDIDGLDDALSAAVECQAQLNLMEMSADNVKRLVGIGAVFPNEIASRRELLDEVDIKIRAGSSGKPNQATELNKWQTESQILSQFGANPQAVIRETIARFDDHLEPADFFPVPMGAPPQQQQPNTKQPPNGEPRPRGRRPNQPQEPQRGGAQPPPQN